MENRGSERLTLDVVELVNGKACARVSTLGAEVVSWSVLGRELLWRRDARHWDRTAPVLFPSVGWSREGRVTINGRSYAMPVHGFAPSLQFEVVSRNASSVVLELGDSEASRSYFPFAFRLRVHYALEAESLNVGFEITNPGAGSLPYACGFHPGFAWPFAGGAQEDYRLLFAELEDASVPVITNGGLISPQRRPIAMQGRMLPLNGATFNQEALCFLDARSRQVTFEGPGGAILIDADGFRHWALWSRPEAPFLCVEAWTGHGDPDGYSGEFADKPSMEHLSAGETRRHKIALRWLMK